jgi:hypothetical protein
VAAEVGRDMACRKWRIFCRGSEYALLSEIVSGPLHDYVVKLHYRS